MPMGKFIGMLAVSVAVSALAASAALSEEITVATVNNGDMIIMQKLSPEWEKATGNKVNWVVLEENVLRERVTTDIATKAGQFDVLTIGGYETPIWGKSGWLMPLDDLGDDYDYADLIAPVRSGLTVDGKLYAVPFYAESSFTLYRKDLFDAAGLKMPEQPTYDQITEFADKLTDKSKEQYGLCLRGKPGWGENMAFLGTLVNTFGGRWFDMDWKPQINSPEWKKAIGWYVDTMKKDGPPGISSNGFNENQTLFASGHCAMWIDATSAAGRVYDPKQSQVADKVAFAKAPVAVTPEWLGLGLGMEPGHPGDVDQGRMRQNPSSNGRPRKPMSSASARPKAGSPHLRERASPPMPARTTRRRRLSPRRCCRRSNPPTRPSRPRIRCPIPASSSSPSPNSRASAPRSVRRSPPRSPASSRSTTSSPAPRPQVERTMTEAGYIK